MANWFWDDFITSSKVKRTGTPMIITDIMTSVVSEAIVEDVGHTVRKIVQTQHIANLSTHSILY